MTEPEPAANPQALTEGMVEVAAKAMLLARKPKHPSLDDDERYWETHGSRDIYLRIARVGLEAALSLSRPAADRGQETCPFCGDDELNLADNEYRSRLIARSNAKVNAMLGQIVEECARVAENYPSKAEPNDRGAGLLRELVSSNIAASIRALSPAPAQTEDKS